MKTKRYFYNLYKTFYSWRKKLISCCLVLQKSVAWQDHQQRLSCIESYAWRRFTNWLTSSRWQDNALTPLRDQWQNCPYNYKTFQKLINFFSLRVANLEVMIVESVRHTRARAGRVETSSFPGFFLFLSREVMCRSFRSFSIPSRNPGHLNFWRLVWSTSEQFLVKYVLIHWESWYEYQ